MEVRFWGVRGSVASSGSQVAKIGGNTSCLEITSQGHRLILDAGTGIRSLGDELMREKKPLHATMLFSHLHWDHVQGFPFFTPAFVPTTQLVLYGPGPGGDRALFSALDAQMRPPGFPVPLSIMGAQMEFRAAEHSFTTGPFRVTPIPLPHPNGCMGYRVEADGASFVYATDVELSADALTPEIAAAFQGVDGLCLDAQYTPDEYAGKVGVPKKGWGHSTMVDAAQVARAVGARRLFLFHHDPGRSDDLVELMAEQAREHFAASEPAREGKRIFLEGRSDRRCA